MAVTGGWFRISYEIEGRTVNRVVDRPSASIGRSPECDIVVPPETTGVGRNHAVFRMTDDGWVVEDNLSRNGTYVNRSRVTTSGVLKPDDLINLGPFELYFEAAGIREPKQSGFNLSSLAENAARVESINNERVPQVTNSVDIAAMSRAIGESTYLADDSSKQAEDSVNTGAIRQARLFHLIGESLVSSTNLNDMLERILHTVFDSVPARSGMVGICDESGEVVPRVSRSRNNEAVKVSTSIVREAMSTESAILIEDTDDYDQSSSINTMNIQSAICVPLYNDGDVNGVIYVETHQNSLPFSVNHLEILSTVALFSAVAIKQAALREEFLREQKHREGLSRYFSPSVVEQIIERADSPDTNMLAEERNVTVLFADLKGFTAMSENMKPPDVVRLINDIWERMNNVVFRHFGALDKFMGDGMMAFFGAPLSINNHAISAVRAGLEMQSELNEFNEKSGQHEIGMRIGINSGPVVMGDIGSERRKDFTVIGDTVNVASRLESTVAAPGQVIIGPSTYEQVQDIFNCEACEAVPLKGKSQTVQPYLVTPE